MVPTQVLAGDPGTVAEHPSSLEDFQTMALNPNPHGIPAIQELAGGEPEVLSQPPPMLQHVVSIQLFRELEEKWYNRYQKLARESEAKFIQHFEMKNKEIKDKAVEISKLMDMVLSERTEKIKLEGNFNLRGALERIAYHGRLIGKIQSHYKQGVQAGLDQLAKTQEFRKILAEEIADRHLVEKDVEHCIPIVYHEASRHAHENLAPSPSSYPSPSPPLPSLSSPSLSPPSSLPLPLPSPPSLFINGESTTSERANPDSSNFLMLLEAAAKSDSPEHTDPDPVPAGGQDDSQSIPARGTLREQGWTHGELWKMVTTEQRKKAAGDLRKKLPENLLSACDGDWLSEWLVWRGWKRVYRRPESN
ncbi:hypothetical protein HOY82DRAFT_625525 [Tuber indicum]|nr:hypothetical protein HOY82DRAFT_625525 [Tuber indicum]